MILATIESIVWVLMLVFLFLICLFGTLMTGLMIVWLIVCGIEVIKEKEEGEDDSEMKNKIENGKWK